MILAENLKKISVAEPPSRELNPDLAALVRYAMTSVTLALISAFSVLYSTYSPLRLPPPSIRACPMGVALSTIIGPSPLSLMYSRLSVASPSNLTLTSEPSLTRFVDELIANHLTFNELTLLGVALLG